MRIPGRAQPGLASIEQKRAAVKVLGGPASRPPQRPEPSRPYIPSGNPARAFGACPACQHREGPTAGIPELPVQILAAS